MASLPASRGDNKKEKKKNKSDEKRRRRKSRGADDAAAADQPEMKPDRPPLQFTSFGNVPAKPQQQQQHQPQQQLTPQQHSDGESMVSGYIYTGMDRDMAEEFILHSMTIQQPSSVKSGNTQKHDVFWKI